MWRYSLRWFSGCPAWGHPRLAASHPRGGAWLSAWISSPGSSSVQPTLGPLAPGHCHGTILHQGEAPGPLFPSFLPLPSPCPSPTLRGGQIFGEPPPPWEGAGCPFQADMPSGRRSPRSPSPQLPRPSIFRSITVHCWVYFFSHSFPRKTARVPPGKTISPSPELVRGSVHAAKQT